MNPNNYNHYAVLTSLLAPALLMAATGTLLTSANNRLARVVDRLRVLVIRWQDTALRTPSFSTQIMRHRRRSQLILSACLFLYGALGSFIITSLGLAIDAFSGYRLQIIPTLMGICGVLCMLTACVFMGMEVWLSVRSFDVELDDDLKELK